MAQLAKIRPEALGLISLAIITMLLAFLNLDSYPRFSFDEGSYGLLAKNLTRYGEYALVSPPQTSDWFGWGTSMPTVIFPISLSFELLGVGILQARLVSSLYMVGAMLAGYVCLRHLYDWQTAWLGVLLFLIAGPSPEFNTILLGRRVLGEAPALFFILLAVCLWTRAWERNRTRELIVPGVLFGLAFVTKEQFIPLVLGAAAMVWLVDYFYQRQLQARTFLVPGLISVIPVGVWYSIQLATLGVESFFQHLAVMRAVSSASTWLIAPQTWMDHIGLLYSSGFLLIGLPGILYALAQGARQDLQGIRLFFLPLLATLCLMWFVFLTVGWARYAYAGLALANLLAGKPLADLLRGLSLTPKRLWEGLRDGGMRHSLVAGIIAVGVLGYPLLNVTYDILFRPDRSPQAMAALVEAHTEPAAGIALLEWEIAFLTSRNYYHPSPEVFAKLLINAPNFTYDPALRQAQCLIDGPYSKALKLYSAALQSGRYQKAITNGPYDLYCIR